MKPSTKTRYYCIDDVEYEYDPLSGMMVVTFDGRDQEEHDLGEVSDITHEEAHVYVRSDRGIYTTTNGRDWTLLCSAT